MLCSSHNWMNWRRKRKGCNFQELKRFSTDSHSKHHRVSRRKGRMNTNASRAVQSLLFFVGGAKLSIFFYSLRWRIISTKPVRMVSRNGEREKPRASSLFGID